MFLNFLCVGLGGAAGAMLRYAISLIPSRTTFPILTLVTNALGALLIGIVVALSVKYTGISDKTILLLKTGLCGGFTTFSTFSLETFDLFNSRHIGLAVLYMVLSLGVCLAGVWAGEKVIS